MTDEPQRHLTRLAASESFSFDFEGRAIIAFPGQSVGAALLAAGIRQLRRAEDGGPRGLLCGIGVCWECRCVIDDKANRRACMTAARPGQRVRRQEGLA